MWGSEPTPPPLAMCQSAVKRLSYHQIIEVTCYSSAHSRRSIYLKCVHLYSFIFLHLIMLAKKVNTATILVWHRGLPCLRRPNHSGRPYRMYDNAQKNGMFSDVQLKAHKVPSSTIKWFVARNLELRSAYCTDLTWQDDKVPMTLFSMPTGLMNIFSYLTPPKNPPPHKSAQQFSPFHQGY